MPFELSLMPEHVTVPAGQSAEIVIHVRNLDEVEQPYTVEVLGLDASVYQLPTAAMAVAGGATGQVPLTLCPPAGGNIRTATYKFRIRATSSSREQNVATANLAIEPGVALKLDLVRTGPNRFEVSLENEASRELEVHLKAEDPRGTAPARSCDYDLERAVVRLDAGERQRIPLRVRPRWRPVLGTGQSHPFTVSATPEILNARSETREGTARSSPVVPWWLPLLLLLSLGGGAFVVMNRTETPPADRAPISRPQAPLPGATGPLTPPAEATGQLAMAIREASLDFGAVRAGQKKKLVLHVEQPPSAGDPVRLQKAHPSTKEFSIASPALPVTLAPGATRELAVVFAPKSAGEKRATLILVSSAAAARVGDRVYEGAKAQRIEIALHGQGR